MHHLRHGILLICMAFAGACGIPAAHAAMQNGASSATTSKDEIAQRLISNERMSWELAIKHEAAPYIALHASDFFTVNGTGVVGKVASEASALDPDVRFDQCDLSGFDTHFVAEDAVLVTYHVKASGLDHGKAFQLESYASSLWMKRGGTWLNVFYQATPVAKK
jgi:hypothetical protein